MGNAPAHFEDMGPRPAPMGKEPVEHRGLRNLLGEHNCFLNVVIQALWHTDLFRTLLLKSPHDHEAEAGDTPASKGTEATPCITCALKRLFSTYKGSKQQILPPDEVRKTLSVLFAPQSKFRLGEMDDAAEALQAMLSVMHQEHNAVYGTLPSHGGDDTGCSPECIAHQSFGYEYYEQHTCTKCGTVSEPKAGRSMVYHVYASDLLASSEQSRQVRSLSAAVRALQTSVGRRSCPTGDDIQDSKTPPPCPGKCTTARVCLSLPRVLVVSMVWPTDQATDAELYGALSVLGQDLNMADLFTLTDTTTSPMYRLTGMVCYYGRHYMAVLYSARYSTWLFFDDGNIRRVGMWADVVRLCFKGRLQPTVLMYESLKPQPVRGLPPIPKRERPAAAAVVEAVPVVDAAALPLHKEPVIVAAIPVGPVPAVVAPPSYAEAMAPVVATAVESKPAVPAHAETKSEPESPASHAESKSEASSPAPQAAKPYPFTESRTVVLVSKGKVLGLRLGSNCVVADVTPGSVAAAAGVRPGEVLSAINGISTAGKDGGAWSITLRTIAQMDGVRIKLMLTSSTPQWAWQCESCKVPSELAWTGTSRPDFVVCSTCSARVPLEWD